MAVNIVETIKGYLTPDVISKTSNMLGESGNAVTKALSAAVPAVLGGLISKANSSHSGANEVLAMSKDTNRSGFPGNLGNMLNSDLLGRGTGFLQNLFGDKLSGIINSIASFAGIKNSSASSLFGLAAPLSTGAVGQYAIENNLDAGGLSSFLSSQKSQVMNMLPAGLSSVLGFGSIGSSLSDAKEKTVASSHYVREEYKKKMGAGWLPWVLLLAAVAVALWYFLLRDRDDANTNKTSNNTTNTIQTTNTDSPTTMSTTVPTNSRESTKVKLPDGTELDAYRGGIEERLVSFLGTDWMGLGEDSLKKLWFDFDNLNFKTGSAEITPESQVQINNLTAILKAFPKAKLKIGGYTDKTGSESANKKLSGDRAKAVKTALEKAGVGSQVTEAEGYGSDFAKYPADAPESDRVKDRRVSVSVRR